MVRKFLSFILVLAMVCVVFAACDTTTQSEEVSADLAESSEDETGEDISNEAEQETYDVVFCCMNMATESQAFSAKMFEEHAAEYGINGTVMDCKGDPAVDSQNVNNAVAQGVDAIIVNPNDINAIIPSLMAAQEAGIVICMFSSDLPEDQQQYRDFYCGADNYESGVSAAEAFLNQFPDGAKIVEIGGQAGHDAQIKRHDGFMSVIEGSNIEVLDSQSCEQWAANDAMNVMQDMIVKYGDDIEGIFCHWDNGHTGIIQAMTNANMDPASIFTVAIDGCKGGYDQVAEGTQTISLSQNFETMAVKSLEVLKLALDGDEFDELNFIEWETISKDTIDTIARPEW